MRPAALPDFQLLALFCRSEEDRTAERATEGIEQTFVVRAVGWHSPLDEQFCSTPESDLACLIPDGLRCQVENH